MVLIQTAGCMMIRPFLFHTTAEEERKRAERFMSMNGIRKVLTGIITARKEEALSG